MLAERPWLDDDAIVFDPVSTLGEYMAQVVDLDAVVASRFHNVLCALMCGVPTIAVGYGDKHRVLMERFGVRRFSHEIRTLDVDSTWLGRWRCFSPRAIGCRRTCSRWRPRRSEGSSTALLPWTT